MIHLPFLYNRDIPVRRRKPIHRLLPYLVLAGLFLLAQAGAGIASPPPARLSSPSEEWITQRVDAPDGFSKPSGRDRMLRLDASGNPHVAYGSENHLFYAWFDGTSWMKEIVDTSLNAYYPALFLDIAGNPHISYSAHGDLRYAVKTGDAWSIETIDIGGNSYTSLALDQQGQAHITYCAHTSALYHAYREGQVWKTELVDSDAGQYNSLGIDGDGNLHVAYYNDDTERLRYAKKTVGTWTTQTVWGSDGGAYASMALDSQDRPHISFYSWISGDNYLRYARWTGSAWDIDLIDGFADMSGYNTSIAIDRSDRPHISYHRYNSGDYMAYAYYTGDQWKIGQVAHIASGTTYAFTSLALDPYDTPRIVYFDTWPDRIVYTGWGGAGPWFPITLATSAQAGYGSSIRLDADGRPHISYVNTEEELKYAHWTGSAWESQVVGSVDFTLPIDMYYGRKRTSLALDSLGQPHIAYVDHGLKYTHWNGTAWQLETVEAFEEDDDHLGAWLALDAGDRPRISYCWSGLKYAAWDGSQWKLTKFEGDNCKITALALDAGGKAHISHVTNNPGGDAEALYYVHWDGSQWMNEQVTTDIYTWGVEEEAPLALDSLGKPHFVFFDNNLLKYAVQDGGTWDIQTIDAFAYQGRHPSLALDSLDRPHIVYYGGQGSNGLRYRYWSGQVWVYSSLGIPAGRGNTSLALDEHGIPHVSTYDSEHGDLVYLTLNTERKIFLPLMIQQ